MIALLDGDIITYRVGFTTMDVDPYIAIARTDESIRNICQSIDTNDYKCYLTAQGIEHNFRYQIDNTYKANRKEAQKPTHYNLIRGHLIENHGAIIAQGEEADDLLGIEQTTRGTDSIICTIDKDLDQIPGWHYNFVKGLRYNISEIEGRRFFYAQLLIGDASDNVAGIKGLGTKRTGALLDQLSTEGELFRVVAKQYKNQYGEEEWLKQLTKTGQLLWIRKQEGEIWTPPVIEAA
jgi:hypothetical protein